MIPMNPLTLPAHLQRETLAAVTRRHFLQRCATGLGAIWLAQQGRPAAAATGHAPTASRDATKPLTPWPPHFPAKAKHVI